jgi:hypothetical protein
MERPPTGEPNIIRIFGRRGNDWALRGNPKPEIRAIAFGNGVERFKGSRVQRKNVSLEPLSL